MEGEKNNSERFQRSIKIIEQFFQNAPEDWEDNPPLEIPDKGTIHYYEAVEHIIPNALIEIGKSTHPDRHNIMLKAIQQPYYPEDENYTFHEVALEKLSECDQSDIVEGIAEWVNDLEYDFDAYGCRDIKISIQYTSLKALETALEICVKHKRREIVSQLERFMEILPWVPSYAPWSEFSELGPKYLAQLEGVDAFESLINRLHYHHPKWECDDDEIDSRVAGAIVSIGKEVIPLLKPYLNPDSDIYEGVVWILEQLGENPSNYNIHH
ncbi:MAG: hypothetical protein ThorAB25_25050 [Candidatus Thorarchaeota archaeon AB_25]|nr:MAG: hypothetical protein ThorAB25_25050 [Candidatus Thorarchaeota archaeon AB_25]